MNKEAQAPGRFTSEEDDLLVNMVNSGCRISDIARAFRRNTGSICTRLSRLRAKGRLTDRPTDPPLDRARFDKEHDAWMAYWRQPRDARRAGDRPDWSAA